VEDYRLAALATFLVSIVGLILWVSPPAKNWATIGWTLQFSAQLVAFVINIAARNIEPRPPAYPGKGTALVLVAAFQMLSVAVIFRLLFTGRDYPLALGLLQVSSVLLLVFYPFNEGKLYGPARHNNKPVSGAP
jgi:hypothetical protein